MIRPSSSPWASPIVLVKKKDGSTRFCVDYRKVNKVTRKDAYPLPRVDDTLDTLAGAKWFSTLDLISGYWQVEMHPDDREKTAFCTLEGLFEFNVMPFGLCNGPATFQRLMDMILAGLQWSRCLVYLDDIIIFGTTFEEHLSNLELVFDRLREAKLRLQPVKCKLCKKKVNFLGHIVSRDGVAADPAKTDKVAEWAVPKCKRDVQCFLGLANYYRRFIQDFATVAKPLHHLTEKYANFKWTEDCQTAFENLRQKLVSAPILAFPDCSKPFILDTDASDTGIGAVLSQQQEDGTERVIAYASRLLSKPERRYCVTRRELLAVVVFITHFRHYLLGNSFTLRTDHGALTWLWNFRNPEGQLARWLERLQEFDSIFSTDQGGGTEMLMLYPDRLPCSQCNRESHAQEETVTTGMVMIEGRSVGEVRKLQEEDPTIGPILSALVRDDKPSPDYAKGQSPEFRKLVQIWDQLCLKDGLLWRRYDHPQTAAHHLAPTVVRRDILDDLDAGAIGRRKNSEQTQGAFLLARSLD